MNRVQVDCKDWRRLLEKFDRADALLYRDPPYHHETCRSNNLYGEEMADKDYNDLLCWPRQTKAKVML